MFNIYEAAYKLHKYTRSEELIADYSYSMGTENCAKELRSIHLDYGRRSGKTSFALDFLNKHWGECIVICPTLALTKYVRGAYRNKYEVERSRKEFGDISCISAAIRATHTKLSTNPDIERTRELLICKAKYVIFDEPGFIKPSDLDTIYRFCKPDVTFIHLGRPRK